MLIRLMMILRKRWSVTVIRRSGRKLIKMIMAAIVVAPKRILLGIVILVLDHQFKVI